MATVHAAPVESLAQQVERPANWSAYMDARNAAWAEAEISLTESNPLMRYIGAWLDAHRPPPLPLVLTHGDFQPSNILVGDDGYQIIDWEFSHIGDPREDLGYYMNYGIAFPPSLYSPDPEAFLAKYRELTGYSELHVNQATVGYFATVAAVHIFAGFLAGGDAMGRGENTGVMTTFNLNSAVYGHSNFLTVCDMLGGPLDELAALAEAGQ
jgi:aminoglycoside phosphotransferase (APT) family kinase protein